MDRLRVGIVGFGFMGSRMHFGCWNRLDEAAVVAICDSHLPSRERLSEQIGNIAGVPERFDLDNVRLFSDFDMMLANASLDVVSLTIPSDLHAELSIKALRAGVAVLCEKPMALTVEDCRRMREAAEQTHRRLMIAHCIRFWPEYAKTKQIVDGGEYGRVLSATFNRLGAIPQWSADGWLLDERRSGGVVLDLHIHDTDYIQYLFGPPAAVRSFAPKQDGTVLPEVLTSFGFDDGKLVTARASWLMAQSFGFQMAFNIVLEKATIVYDSTAEPTLKLCLAEGQVVTPELAEGDGYQREISHFADLLTGKETVEVIPLAESERAVQIALAQCESLRTGELVRLT